MSRQSTAPRALSLTEELEKLEQSITLTLQEIDHNFSKAHRIVTTSIIPLVEQYGEQSRAVWDASKFWKQFFEASANVSLSGYEELADDGDTTVAEDESTDLKEGDSIDYTAQDAGGESLAVTPRTARNDGTFHGDESLIDDGELSGSTPRPPATKTIKATQMSSLESPYEVMRREMKSEEGENTTLLESEQGDDSTAIFAQQTARLPDMSMTPKAANSGQSNGDRSTQKSKDPLLHRVLDKNYRLQATPHKTGARITPKKAHGHHDAKAADLAWQDSPMSSPEIALPTLRSAAFMSPYKGTGARGGQPKATAAVRAAAAARAAAAGPRTPGVSVQTPGAAGGRKARDALATGDRLVSGGSGRQKQQQRRERDEIDWDSDDDADLYEGMSPPKTIQFAVPPSKLLQTPAREASKRIVEDILLDAGADPESSEYSPTMVKMNEGLLDESF